MENCAEMIGVPLDQWPGNCYAIACGLVKHNLIAGEPVYGAYWGMINPTSRFANRIQCGFCHHGWIQNVEDGEIVDPTRWVFLDCKPFMHSTSLDDADYDAGSNRVREMFLRPPPEFDPTQETKFSIPTELRPLLKNVLGDEYEAGDRVCLAQAQWVASLPTHFLGEQVKDVYEWVAGHGWKALIPIDNQYAVLGQEVASGS